MKVKLYVEGGGDSDFLRTECRKGFRKLLEAGGLKNRMPRIVAAGSRQSAYDLFCTAIENSGPDEFPMLLVDSEAPVSANKTVWQHLEQREGDRWKKPDGAAEDQVFLMVQCMEAWFFADKQKLNAYFGANFLSGTLSANPKIEEISKTDIFRQLKEATRNCKNKRLYEKGEHSFNILGLLDPKEIRSASPHADRFFASLLVKCR